MSESEYCDRTFENGEQYVAHLRNDHYHDLGRIDKQRVDTQETTNRLSTGLTALALVGPVVVAGAAYAFVSSGRGGGGQALSLTYPGCGEYCAACPRCPDILANATAEIPGVSGAKFVANQTHNATAVINFRPNRTSVAEITQTSPFPGCCDDPAVVAHRSTHRGAKATA